MWNRLVSIKERSSMLAYSLLGIEQRRVALENALKENRQLHEEVEVLTAENKHLQKIADHCGELAELVKALTADDDEGDNDVNGNEEETPNETNES